MKIKVSEQNRHAVAAIVLSEGNRRLWIKNKAQDRFYLAGFSDNPLLLGELSVRYKDSIEFIYEGDSITLTF